MKSSTRNSLWLSLLLVPFLAGCNHTTNPDPGPGPGPGPGPDPVTNKLTNITVSESAKKSYNYGEDFVTPEVIAQYEDETTKEVSQYCTFTGFDSLKSGDQKIDVSYKEDTITKTTNYTVNVKEADFGVKFAIFADIQLCSDTAINGESATNLGTTANAPLALKSHFEFCKKNNINYILMNGDITNQANEHYYDYFERIFKSVYGTDESKYPELVWNMGNHEWWWGTTEKETGDAVTMFKKYARIQSPYLVKESKVSYGINPSQTVPSYYKVINGIPFITISAESSNGNVGTQLAGEITSWLNESKQLPSVKKGGPIFVQYHYPLSTSMTHGQGSIDTCTTVEEIFKDTPNAVIFTGDTHFPGINERAINQVNFTTINLGSSSYSRMVNASATECNDFYNVQGTGSKIDDKMSGNAKFKEAYTPTIQVVDVKSDASYTIDRYFTGEDERKVGETWSINPIKTKSDFTYTNARFENKEAAKELYGKEGLSWDSEDKVTFGVNLEQRQMTVHFKDVKEHHFVEHYKITVNGSKVYDVVSNYYKYPVERENNYYVLDDIPTATNYSVKVEAYDFFDNVSLNSLSSSTMEEDKAVEAIDYQATATYCDIQTRNVFDDVASENSNSAIEYYYKGIQEYRYGALLNRLCCPGSVDCSNFISLQGDDDCEPTVTMKVKNKGTGDLVLGLSVVEKTATGESWKDDFSQTQKEVTGSDWVELTWNLKKTFNITKKSQLANISVKAKSTAATSSGYVMDFIVDDIDIQGKSTSTKRDLVPFVAEKDSTTNIAPLTLDDELVIDFRFDNAQSGYYINLALMDDWSNYAGYYTISQTGIGSGYDGVTFTTLDDGFVRVTFDLDKLTRINGTFTGVTFLYTRGIWSNVGGVFEVNPSQGNPVRGASFVGGVDYTKDFTTAISLDQDLTFDVKFNSDESTKISLMLGDGWSNYFGYYQLNSTTTSESYKGVTVTTLTDGYIRFVFDLDQLDKLEGTPQKVTLLYIRGVHSDANGFIDILL